MIKIPKPNPCPKCGGECLELSEIDGPEPWWRVVCLECDYEGASEPTIRRAVEWHNQEIEHTG